MFKLAQCLVLHCVLVEWTWFLGPVLWTVLQNGVRDLDGEERPLNGSQRGSWAGEKKLGGSQDGRWHLSPLSKATRGSCDSYLSFWIDQLDYPWLRQPGLRDTGHGQWGVWNSDRRREWCVAETAQVDTFPQTLDTEKHSPLIDNKYGHTGKGGGQLSFTLLIHSPNIYNV